MGSLAAPNKVSLHCFATLTLKQRLGQGLGSSQLAYNLVKTARSPTIILRYKVPEFTLLVLERSKVAFHLSYVNFQ